MNIALWVNELIDENGNVVIGGVQTYTLELADGFRKNGLCVDIYQKGFHSPQFIDALKIISLNSREWRSGKYDGKYNVNIDINPNDPPMFSSRNTIAVQHGVYWDREVSSKLWKKFGILANSLRMYRGSKVLDKYRSIVCVDLAFSLQASCIRGGVEWDKIHYIPNFAPETNEQPDYTNDIEKIVFSRRFVEHRGTRLFADAIMKVLNEGWDGEVHIIGTGPDENWLRMKLNKFNNVKIYSLPYSQRLQAFDDKSVVVIPTISTEGTSLSCLEAWSKGALVVSTGVGGLANIVINNFNAVMVRPLVNDVYLAIKQLLSSSGHDISRIRRRGFEMQQLEFTREVWLKKWLDLVYSHLNIKNN